MHIFQKICEGHVAPYSINATSLTIFLKLWRSSVIEIRFVELNFGYYISFPSRASHLATSGSPIIIFQRPVCKRVYLIVTEGLSKGFHGQRNSLLVILVLHSNGMLDPLNNLHDQPTWRIETDFHDFQNCLVMLSNERNSCLLLYLRWRTWVKCRCSSFDVALRNVFEEPFCSPSGSAVVG